MSLLPVRCSNASPSAPFLSLADDFDHGLEHTTAAMNAANFPFLLSNAVDLRTGEPLAGALRTLVIEHSGIRIGLIGLIEEEWLATLACVEPSQVQYTDFVAVANELEPRLREEGCELVFALTHSRLPNDKRLAAQCPGLDLILGGHDHDAFREVVNGVPVIKSGTDFRELTAISLAILAAPCARAENGPPGGVRDSHAAARLRRARCEVRWEGLLVTSDIPEDEEAAAMVSECSRELASSMNTVLAELAAPLDFRFASIRTEETSGSNFIADLLASAVPSAHVVLFNSGTLRAVSRRAGVRHAADVPLRPFVRVHGRSSRPHPAAAHALLSVRTGLSGRRLPAGSVHCARPHNAAADAG